VNALTQHRPRDTASWTVPLPTRRGVLLLVAGSALFTALVYSGAIGVVWLVAGPTLTFYSWFLWAVLRRRRALRAQPPGIDQ